MNAAMIRRRTGVAAEEASVRRLFPSLADRPAARIDLDAAFQWWRRANPDRWVPGAPAASGVPLGTWTSTPRWVKCPVASR